MYHTLVENLIGAGLSSLAKQIKNITKQEAIDDYDKLREVDCKDINQRSLVGNKAMDYFFLSHRLRTKGNKGISFAEWLKTDLVNKPYNKKLTAEGLRRGQNLAQARYKAFRLYYGSINAFKPLIARNLYCIYDPKTILDFSAGWGGRCLGAMSLDKNYIGYDTNKTLIPAYKGMKALYPTKGKIEIHFQDSSKADFSKHTYDMVFTSPPYFQKTRPTEKYEKMPEYENREDFNERFLYPVIRNAYKHLSHGGFFCLNIPSDMYDDVKTVLGGADRKIPLVIALRKPRTSDKVGKINYTEFIYVWKK
jgi:hypothetical protein